MCNAEIADAADGPDGAAETDGLAVDNPDTGSDFEVGQSPLPPFLRMPVSALERPFG